MTEQQQERARKLLQAQEDARRLFEAVEAEGLIRAGITESTLNADIYALAERMFGISKYWHKRIIRAGVNTMAPYAEDPPDLEIGGEDILFLDLGPVFEEWEADFGRTFVLGTDPVRHRLRQDVGAAFAAGKKHFHANPEIRSDELFQYVVELAEGGGWEFGGRIAGHLIGQFPHERIPEDKITLYVHPKNHNRMREPDANGDPRHWILEIHFVDRARKIGGFYEELLTL